MYSRFTPGPDGVYQRRRVAAASTPAGGKPPVPLQNPPRVLPTQVVPSAPPCESVSPPKPMPPSLKNRLAKLLPKGMELGDVLVLLIALLLLIESEEDMQTILITAAAFFLF